MRAVRFLAAISIVAGVVAVVACQEPTQVTIDVRLATARCQEIHGTAIIVGVRPEDAEGEVKSKSPHAQTTDCDDATSRIGTLVITPSDEERASVIVVASYGTQRNPTECQPPLYTDCIVARRQFTFTKHRRLSLPITLDPTCVNVPCDAFSTCRKGLCFTSEVAPCEGTGDCLEPGATADGGTDPDAAVDGSPPDAFIDGPPPTGNDASDGASDDGDSSSNPGDTGSDADAFPGPDAGGVSCDVSGYIVCPPVATACTTSGPNACCGDLPEPQTCVATVNSSCPSNKDRWCCRDEDCGGGLFKCLPLDGGPNLPRKCCSTTAMSEAGAMIVPLGSAIMCP